MYFFCDFFAFVGFFFGTKNGIIEDCCWCGIGFVGDLLIWFPTPPKNGFLFFSSPCKGDRFWVN